MPAILRQHNRKNIPPLATFSYIDLTARRWRPERSRGANAVGFSREHGRNRLRRPPPTRDLGLQLAFAKGSKRVELCAAPVSLTPHSAISHLSFSSLCSAGYNTPSYDVQHVFTRLPALMWLPDLVGSGAAIHLVGPIAQPDLAASGGMSFWLW